MYMLRIGRDSDVDVELTPSKRYVITNKNGESTQCENVGAITLLNTAMRNGVKVPNKWLISRTTSLVSLLNALRK
jgi:hypothetical protein